MTRPCWLISSSLYSRRHPGVPRRAPRRFLPQLAGECEVTYTGRAQSVAKVGDYLLTVKPDGRLMIHRAKGVKPRNWQPTTDCPSATLEERL